MTADLVARILNSAAARNSFFDRCKAGAPAQVPGAIVIQWLPITRTYCLNLARYTSLLAERAELAPPEVVSVWEDALLVPTQLFAEEMSGGTRGRDGMHFRMFERLGEVWSLPPGAPPMRLNGETQALAETMRAQLATPFGGAACILVVEQIAWSIVDAYQRLLRQCPPGSANRLYLDLHLETEPGHATRAANLCTSLETLAGATSEIERNADEIIHRFGKFWEALARDVFGGEEWRSNG